MSKNSEIVNKNIFHLAVQIVGKNIIFYYFVMYQNHNVSIFIMPWCIMLYYHYESYDTYVFYK
jgi:hypothetical protein